MESTSRSCRVHNLDLKREVVSVSVVVQVLAYVAYKTYLEPLSFGQVSHTTCAALALPGNNGHQLAHPGSGRCC